MRTVEIDALRTAWHRSPREVPSRYFYDAVGSALFDVITLLPEYYPTRAETALLEARVATLLADVRPRSLFELGSGSGRKTALILAAMGARAESCTFLDVSEEALAASVERTREAFPGLRVQGIAADFLTDLHHLRTDGEQLVLLLAGTLGNLRPSDVPAFLGAIAARMAPSDSFLVGLDTVKDPAVLHAAYNDALGVTAAFNRNALRVVNREFGADFDVGSFEHLAFWDAENAWMDLRLVAQRAMTVTIEALGQQFAIEAGEEVRTELSCKYTRASFSDLAQRGGLRVDAWETDGAASFALVMLKRPR